MPQEYAWLAQAGPSAVLFGVLLAIWRGDLRTRFEVEVERARADKAEIREEKLREDQREATKAINKMTDAYESRMLGAPR